MVDWSRAGILGPQHVGHGNACPVFPSFFVPRLFYLFEMCTCDWKDSRPSPSRALSVSPETGFRNRQPLHQEGTGSKVGNLPESTFFSYVASHLLTPIPLFFYLIPDGQLFPLRGQWILIKALLSIRWDDSSFQSRADNCDKPLQV